MLYSILDTHGDDEHDGGGQGQLFRLLMVNTGQLVYPEYSIKKEHCIFRGRDDVIRFENALQLESDLLQCTERGIFHYKFFTTTEISCSCIGSWYAKEKDS